jgi:cytochrome P450
VSASRSVPSFNRIQTILQLRKHSQFIPGFGDYVRDHLGGTIKYRLNEPGYYVTDPELAHEIFHLDYRQGVKSRDYDELRPFQGNGPVLSSGNEWLSQRRMTAQSFTRKQLEKSVAKMNAEVMRMIDRWHQRAAKNEEFNIVPDLNEMTFRVLCTAIIGQDLDSFQDVVYKEINDSLYLYQKRVFSILKFPMWVPTPVNRAYAHTALRYRDAVQKIIDAADASESNTGMLASLIRQKGRKDKDVLDIMATMLAAGFETTANAIAWTLVHLASNPNIQQRLYEEIDAKWGSAPLDATFIDQLPYAVWVLKEGMRLNPPLWLLGRTCKAAVKSGNVEIPANSAAFINLWSINRHPDYWERPTDFLPERFNPERLTERQEKAFVSFASGPRECQGKQFAMIELQIILINFMREFNLQLAAGFRVEPEVALVIRPRNGVRVRLTSRQPEGRSVADRQTTELPR